MEQIMTTTTNNNQATNTVEWDGTLTQFEGKGVGTISKELKTFTEEDILEIIDILAYDGDTDNFKDIATWIRDYIS